MNERIQTADGISLYRRTWQCSERDSVGTLLLVHGLGEHIERYDSHARQWAGQGWRVIGFDLRGHGRSSGKRGVVSHLDDYLDDLACILRASTSDDLRGHPLRDGSRVAERHPRFGLLGHSMGGLIAARYLAELLDEEKSAGVLDLPQIDFCILSSPALAIRLNPFQRLLLKTLGTYLPDVAVPNGLNPKWLSNDLQVVENYRRDPLVHSRVSGRTVQFMLESISKVQFCAPRWRVPTLLLYSGDDRCVDPAGSDAFANTAPPTVVESSRFDQFKHEILNEGDQGVFRKISQRLDRESS